MNEKIAYKYKRLQAICMYVLYDPSHHVPISILYVHHEHFTRSKCHMEAQYVQEVLYM